MSVRPVPTDPGTEQRPTRAAAAVLTATHRHGPVFRDQLVAATDLSNATVNRQVAALLAAGLIRERPDLVPGGVVGRPRVPVEVHPEGFAVLGLHIGPGRVTLAAADLRGRILGALDVPHPGGAPARALAELTRRLLAFGARWPDRTVVRIGVVVSGSGTVRHPGPGWDDVPVADLVRRAAGVEVTVLPGVEAMARADALLAGADARGGTLYVHAADTVDAVLTPSAGMHAPVRALGAVGHLPVGGSVVCGCGATGCLEAVAGESAVAEAARAAGIVEQARIDRVIDAAEGGDRAAHELLVARARHLGTGAALLRDVLNPARVVLLGPAFTGYRPALGHVSAAFAERSVLPPLTPRVSPLGRGEPALAAVTAALLPVYADPLAAVRRRVAIPAMRAVAG
jgi:predicted NBD/HSP70 family sugar kinase